MQNLIKAWGGWSPGMWGGKGPACEAAVTARLSHTLLMQFRGKRTTKK